MLVGHSFWIRNIGPSRRTLKAYCYLWKPHHCTSRVFHHRVVFIQVLVVNVVHPIPDKTFSGIQWAYFKKTMSIWKSSWFTPLKVRSRWDARISQGHAMFTSNGSIPGAKPLMSSLKEWETSLQPLHSCNNIKHILSELCSENYEPNVVLWTARPMGKKRNIYQTT